MIALPEASSESRAKELVQWEDSPCCVDLEIVERVRLQYGLHLYEG
jgi:hypothetical protein